MDRFKCPKTGKIVIQISDSGEVKLDKEWLDSKKKKVKKVHEKCSCDECTGTGREAYYKEGSDGL